MFRPILGRALSLGVDQSGAVCRPIAAWLVCRSLVPRWAYLAAFFAGFCLIANGAYLAFGWTIGAGDAGDLLRHGAAVWQLVLFGLPTMALGLWFWNGLGPHFGFGVNAQIDRRAVIGISLGLLALLVIEWIRG